MQNEKNNSSDRELKISRIFNAPIELVWEVWTNPEHIQNWWGPNGFSTTIHKMEMVEGSEWLLTMHGPDGRNYPNKSVFKEIVPHQRIVFRHFNPNFTTTVEFEAQGETTLLQWHMLFDTVKEFEVVVKTFKADEGLQQNIEKLENYLLQKNNHYDNDFANQL
ncbi:MAG: SRPBCC family protein [Sphingobacteriia bacterium]|nr:SRPBCC family protein [Sphingobacteriia bacterium]